MVLLQHYANSEINDNLGLSVNDLFMKLPLNERADLVETTHDNNDHLLSRKESILTITQTMKQFSSSKAVLKATLQLLRAHLGKDGYEHLQSTHLFKESFRKLAGRPEDALSKHHICEECGALFTADDDGNVCKYCNHPCYAKDGKTPRAYFMEIDPAAQLLQDFFKGIFPGGGKCVLN